MYDNGGGVRRGRGTILGGNLEEIPASATTQAATQVRANRLKFKISPGSYK